MVDAFGGDISLRWIHLCNVKVAEHKHRCRKAVVHELSYF
jgi:hypothetical protein